MTWNIEVPHLNGGWTNHHNEFTDTDVVAKAKKLSITYPTVRVSISAMARNRMVFRAGEMVQEFPDINHFYTNIDKTTQQRWTSIT